MVEVQKDYQNVSELCQIRKVFNQDNQSVDIAQVILEIQKLPSHQSLKKKWKVAELTSEVLLLQEKQIIQIEVEKEKTNEKPARLLW